MQGNPCNENMTTATKTGFLVMKTGFCLYFNVGTGKPFNSGNGFAVYIFFAIGGINNICTLGGVKSLVSRYIEGYSF